MAGHDKRRSWACKEENVLKSDHWDGDEATGITKSVRVRDAVSMRKNPDARGKPKYPEALET